MMSPFPPLKKGKLTFSFNRSQYELYIGFNRSKYELYKGFNGSPNEHK